MSFSVFAPLVTLTLVIDGALTTSDCVTLAVEPDASVTVSMTENLPVFLNVCLGDTPVAVPPSPKLQLYPVNVEPESVDRVPSNANGTSATGCPATVAIPAVGTPVILSRWLEWR